MPAPEVAAAEQSLVAFEPVEFADFVAVEFVQFVDFAEWFEPVVVAGPA